MEDMKNNEKILAGINAAMRHPDAARYSERVTVYVMLGLTGLVMLGFGQVAGLLVRMVIEGAKNV